MASSNNDLQITIGATAATLQGDLNQARSIVDNWAREVQASSKNAEAGFKGVAGALKDYASEQRQQGRVASFFVRELAEVAPISNSAKTALSGLVGAFAGGFGLGMAIDLALTGVKLLSEGFREQTAEMEEARKKAFELSQAEMKAWEEAQKREEERRGQKGAGIVKRLADLDREIAVARAGLGGEEGRADRVSEVEHEIKIRDLRRESWREGAAGRGEIAAALEMQVAKEIELFGLVRQRAAEERQAAAAKAHYAEMSRQAKLAQEAEKAQAESRRQWYEQNLDSESSVDSTQLSMISGAGYSQADLNKAELKRRLEAMDEEKKKTADLIKSYQQWGNVAGGVMGDLVMGHKTLGEAAAAVGQKIIAQVVDTAIASITADAARAGAGAAAAEAGIPVVGPVLAIAAMGAMVSSVMGLLGNVGAREMGGDVRYRSPYIVGERGPELFVPNTSGTIVPNHRLGSGSGGGITVNIDRAFDARGVAQVFLDHNGAVGDALRRAARRRRA